MDFQNQKTFQTSGYPVHAEQTSGLLRRVEPMLTPEQLVSRFFKGVPLVMPNGDTYTADDFKDRIYLACNEAEILVGRNINREAFKDKLPFDWALYNQFIHLKTEHGPIISLERLSICASDGTVIYEIPNRWIESANFAKNTINVVPLLAAYGGASVSGTIIGPTTTGAGAAFLAVWGAAGNSNHIPGYWQVQYTAGLSNTEGKVPTIVNELVGTIAAIAILSEIAPILYPLTSQSLSQDGLSQSSSGPGPMIFLQRIEELMRKRDEYVKKIKAIFASKYFVSEF
jgi:hypothetical protein